MWSCWDLEFLCEAVVWIQERDEEQAEVLRWEENATETKRLLSLDSWPLLFEVNWRWRVKLIVGGNFWFRRKAIYRALMLRRRVIHSPNCVARPGEVFVSTKAAPLGQRSKKCELKRKCLGCLYNLANNIIDRKKDLMAVFSFVLWNESFDTSIKVWGRGTKAPTCQNLCT